MVPSPRTRHPCWGRSAARRSRLNRSMRNFPRGFRARAIPSRTRASSLGLSKYPNDVNMLIAASNVSSYRRRRMSAGTNVGLRAKPVAAFLACRSMDSERSTPVTEYPRLASSTEWRPAPQARSRILAPLRTRKIRSTASTSAGVSSWTYRLRESGPKNFSYHCFVAFATAPPWTRWVRAVKNLPRSAHDARTRLPADCLRQVIDVTHHDALSAGSEELDGRFDFGTHAPGRELACRKVGRSFLPRHSVEESLGRLPEVQCDLRDVGDDDEVLRPDLPREDSGREVLVHDGLDADESPVRPDDRNPAAPRRDDDRAVLPGEQYLDRVRLDDLQRTRRRDEPAVAAPNIVGEAPALRALHDEFVLARIVRPDGFRRVVEGGIFLIHDDPRDHAHGTLRQAAGFEGIIQGLDEHVPDLRLALRDADVERHCGSQTSRFLVLEQDVAYLRPVPVRQDEIVPEGNELRELRAGRLDASMLARCLCGFSGGEDRIASNRKDDSFHADTGAKSRAIPTSL